MVRLCRLPGLAVLVFLSLAVLEPKAQAKGWKDFFPSLTDKIKTLWQNRELQFVDNTCYYYQRPTFYRWKLYFVGRFFCPELTRINGSSKSRKQVEAMLEAIEDFIHKTKDRNLISEEEAARWLNGLDDSLPE